MDTFLMKLFKEMSEKIRSKVSQKLMDEYGVSLHEAAQKNPDGFIEMTTVAWFDFLNSPEGQDYLFKGFNSTSMIYSAIARHDYIYRYIGKNFLNPYDIFPASDLQMIEKDSLCCEEDGCSTSCRPKWCVKEYIVNTENKTLCNFCASTLMQGGKIERCLADSDECHGCANHNLAKTIHMDSGLLRDDLTRQKGEKIAVVGGI